jgi:hypothetical protein
VRPVASALLFLYAGVPEGHGRECWGCSNSSMASDPNDRKCLVESLSAYIVLFTRKIMLVCFRKGDKGMVAREMVRT